MASPPHLVTELTDELLDGCERLLMHRFRDRTLLRRAMTHASAARTRLDSNERMEFLGDAVLGAVVCEKLFEMFPDSAEGELTRIKSIVVSRNVCARLTRKLNLQQYLVAGKGVAVELRVPGSILAAQFEAVVAAIYLDGGFEAARTFIIREMGEEIVHAAEKTSGVNFKSLLQQQAQRDTGETPNYETLDEQGPDHSKCFKVSAMVGTRCFAPAWGPNKKEAEQRAAQNALAQLADLPVPHVAD